MAIDSADLLAALDEDAPSAPVGPDPRPGYSVPVVDTEHSYVTAYADGSSTGKWGVGGWGWCVVDGPQAGREGHGGHHHTTNQRMELQAAHEAVRAIDGLLLVVSDSQYVVRTFTDRWWERWVERRFRKTANSDLWIPFLADVFERRGEVRFAWVKGHAGLVGNERADVLAKTGKIEQTEGTA